ncbi:MAG TPA: sphingomyelin phosphodiesterase [Chitinophagales bacterium]|nr:sphingomyelin phosphodiesterase [Chitinophagales bacterium]
MFKYILLFAILVATVFPETTFAQTEQSIESPQREDSLKLLSWNIYMLPPMVMFTGKNKRASIIGEELANSDYDVLVLQEAFLAGARKRIYNKLKHEYPYEVGPAFRELYSLKTSSGIWILSKHPMKEIAKVKFKRKSGFDNKMARKGALMVEVNKNGQIFEVIGTHLNAGGTLDIKASQIRQIKEELIDVYHNENHPLVVAGDFNIDKYEENGLDSMICILDMNDYGLEGERQHTFDFTRNDLGDGKSKGVIDFVYFKPGKLKVRNSERRIPLIEKIWSKTNKSLSDHNPIELLLYYHP